MSLLAYAGPLVTSQTKAPTTSAGLELHRVAPSYAFYAGLIFIAMFCLWYWSALQRHLAKCTCDKEG